MNLFSVISLTLLLLSGFLLGTAHSTSRERIIALIAFAVSGVVALVQVSVLGLTPISPKDFSPEELFIHFRPYVEFAFCCMGFVCAGLSSLVDCQTRSFRSMLLFVASAMLFLHVYHNIVFAIALWGLSSYLLYRELSYSKEQEIGARAARLFYYYHGISLVALTVG
ncbi:MAG: hypothetical protein KDD70_10110, partial [Bdellovibrionales bacterium]|nr:hypothetical protein [Bdellovibrionales bacterium]